jgi:predicted aconitase with swiveling domain
MELKGRMISKGKAKGTALVSKMGISFFGGVDPDTGVIVEKGHDLEKKTIAGKIFIFPQGKGSTVGSYTLYRMKKNNVAPKAIINNLCETVVAVGAIISEIPCIDMIDIKNIKNGVLVEVDADRGVIRVSK